MTLVPGLHRAAAAGVLPLLLGDQQPVLVVGRLVAKNEVGHIHEVREGPHEAMVMATARVADFFDLGSYGVVKSIGYNGSWPETWC